LDDNQICAARRQSFFSRQKGDEGPCRFQSRITARKFAKLRLTPIWEKSSKMEKRYQVSVSSTFADLHQEREAVIRTLMEMDCIPAGMELFPAANEEQFKFIKKVIDDCDYYLLIIWGSRWIRFSRGY
jgi:hypothetical protein